jgi:hypothetical protein
MHRTPKRCFTISKPLTETPPPPLTKLKKLVTTLVLTITLTPLLTLVPKPLRVNIKRPRLNMMKRFIVTGELSSSHSLHSSREYRS